MRALIFICACLIFIISSQARTITVDDDGPADFNNIQAAIDDANDGDDIVIADGTYTGPGNRDITFQGKRLTVRSTDPNDPNVVAATIIDCNGSATEQHRGFYFHSQEDSNSVLRGLTVRNGYVLGCGMEMGGGGILIHNSSPMISNCVITGNAVGLIPGCMGFCFGGGICIVNRSGASSSPVVTACIINSNTAGDFGWGGGICCSCESSDGAVISNCTISANTAMGYLGAGGGIHCSGSGNLIISNCTITGNTAKDSGGGVWCAEDTIITACILWDNPVNEVYGYPRLTYSDVQGAWPGLGNIDADPCFVQPGYWDHNGTPNYIWDDFWVDGDYHLLPTSPCIDAGDPSYVPEPNETDLDGNPRVTGYAVDMGAYEYPLPLVAQIHIQPRTINLRSQGKWLTCRISLPDGYNAADIDPDTIFLEDEIKTASFRTHSGAPGAVAFFSRRDLQDILDPGRVELTITGRLKDGTDFVGTDTIKVLNNPPPKPARTRKRNVNLKQLLRINIANG